MNCIELSIRNLEIESKKLAVKIEKEFQPDVVIFIAKGSFLIGQTISEYLRVPLLEIHAVRKGNKLKEFIKPVIKIIPKSLKEYLRRKEIQSGVHNQNIDREIYFDKSKYEMGKINKILVVDDSVDTGHTANQVVKYLGNIYSETEIKFASLNYFKDSVNIFSVDYSLYEDYILIGPWSNDSKYNKEFIGLYDQWRELNHGEA
ncbi:MULTISPECIES: phosphoribosyltransferase [Bacillus cereus group]|uniref:phosphoribosyltransferase n=1 Tax=Bacillus cereus group TaxID=86661 RepID=UPI000BFD4FDC|nr:MULTISPECIES: phosphoribosyltransferase family protein [Bacillus cereus group]PGT18404.1 phosphoribosyltransferase [Bacillus cereus]